MPDRPARFRWRLVYLLLSVLVFYWLLMFAGTHISRPVETAIHANDKLLHFSGYCGLALLLVVWRQLGRPLSVKILATSLAMVALYGAADEITQIPVGRDCEFNDWLADVLGGSGGCLLGAAAIGVFRRVRPPVSSDERGDK